MWLATTHLQALLREETTFRGAGFKTTALVLTCQWVKGIDPAGAPPPWHHGAPSIAMSCPVKSLLTKVRICLLFDTCPFSWAPYPRGHRATLGRFLPEDALQPESGRLASGRPHETHLLVAQTSHFSRVRASSGRKEPPAFP